MEKETGNVATVGWTQEPTLHGVILQSTGSTLSQTSATDAQDFHHADTRRESERDTDDSERNESKSTSQRPNESGTCPDSRLPLHVHSAKDATWQSDHVQKAEKTQYEKDLVE